MMYQIWHVRDGAGYFKYVVYANIHHIGTYPKLSVAEARANEHNASLDGEPLTPWGPIGGPVLACKVTCCQSGTPGAVMAMPNPRKRAPKKAQPDYSANPFRLES